MIFTPLPQAARPSRLLSASPRPLALEARFMFDGAAAATGAEALVDTEPSVEASQASPVLGIAYPISNTDGEITREASHVNVASTGLEIGGISLPDTDEGGHGNDVLVRMDIGGTTYYGWISGQTRARDGYYFWTDPSFTTAQDALDGWKQGNKDNDKNNVGFILATGSIQITEGQAQINSSMDVDKLMKCLLPVPNAIPLARNDTETVSEDSAATTIDVLTNDEDSDGGTLTVTGFTVAGDDTEYTAENNTATFPGQGTLTLNADGTFTFTPAPNFHGDLPAITYTLSDGQGGFATATLSISVTPVNDIPVARNDAETVNEDSAATTIDVLANDEDSDGGTLTVTGFTVAGDDTKYTTENNTATFPGQGTLTLNADGTFTFTPATHFHGTVSPIYYTLSDGQEGSATATLSITVTPVNDAPTASDDIASTPEDTPVFLTASDFGNFQDVDTAALTAVRIVSLPVEGVLQYQDYRGDWLSVTENQEIAAATLKQEALRFIPDAHEWATGYATLQFQVSDGQAWSDVHNLTLHVDSVNDLPENTVPEAQLLASGQTLMLDDVEVADADGEEAIEKVEISAENGTLNATEPVAGVNVSGSGSDTLVLRGTRSSLNLMFATVAYVPDPGFSGTDTLTVATTDTAGAQDTDTVSLTVSAEPPRSLFSSAPPPTTLAAPAPPEASAQAPLPPPTSQPIVVDTTPRGHIPQVFDSTLFPQRAAALVQPTYLIEPSPSQPHPLQRTLALWAFNEAYTEAPDDGWRVVVHPDTGSLLSVFRGMPDQFIEGDGMAYVSVPWDSFFHTHSNVRVTVNASLADGTPLPNWIQLNPDTGVFQLVPPRGFQGELAIRLQARDSQGREATTLFRLHVGERAQTSPRENGVPGRSALSDQLRDASRQRQSVFTPLPPQPVTPPALHPA